DRRKIPGDRRPQAGCAAPRRARARRARARRGARRAQDPRALPMSYNEVMKIALAVALVLAVAVPALAQQVDIRGTPPAREPRQDFVTPGPYYDITEPRENQWYAEPVRVPFEPAFIAPLSEEYETATTRGRY